MIWSPLLTGPTNFREAAEDWQALHRGGNCICTSTTESSPQHNAATS